MQRALRTWGTPITLILLLALLGYGAWWGWTSLTRPPAPVVPDPCVSQSMETLKSTQVSVRVFNGGGKTGLAGSTAAVLRTKGFKVPVVDNTTEVITTTVVVGSKADDPQVQLVQGFFPASAVRGDGRVDSTIDVLVGSEFGGIEENAATEIAVPGGQVCLPATPTPTPAEGESAPAEGEAPAEGGEPTPAQPS